MDLLVIGRISGTHHLKGAVKVILNIENYHIIDGQKIILESEDKKQQILSVKNISPLVGNKYVIEFNEITNKTDANLLKNAYVKVKRELLGIGEDEYLMNDLLNMQVIDLNTKEIIGEIKDIFETAAHDIIVVESKEKEAMIPHIDEFVKEINFEERIVYVKPLEGMVEIKGKKNIQDDGLEENED